MYRAVVVTIAIDDRIDDAIGFLTSGGRVEIVLCLSAIVEYRKVFS